jgi:hypothetical protein
MAFPTVFDCADHNYRLAPPKIPTVPCPTWHMAYQRPTQGFGVECRRACQCTPYGDAAAAPPAGASEVVGKFSMCAMCIIAYCKRDFPAP